MIYFVQQDETGPIKIGCTTNVDKRLAQLQIGSAVPLRLLGVMTGHHAQEASLHEQFAKDRLEGEWFSPSRELLEYIERWARIHADSTPPSRKKKRRVPHNQSRPSILRDKPLRPRNVGLTGDEVLDAVDEYRIIFSHISDPLIASIILLAQAIMKHEIKFSCGKIGEEIHGALKNLGEFPTLNIVSEDIAGVHQAISELKDRLGGD